jgi:hypothetical protein
MGFLQLAILVLLPLSGLALSLHRKESTDTCVYLNNVDITVTTDFFDNFALANLRETYPNVYVRAVSMVCLTAKYSGVN